MRCPALLQIALMLAAIGGGVATGQDDLAPQLAEWVRQTLRSALRTEPSGTADKKLARLRASLAHAFPAPDIDQMLAEIEQGYASRQA